jgi:hypothetical protein
MQLLGPNVSANGHNGKNNGQEGAEHLQHPGSDVRRCRGLSWDSVIWLHQF